MTPSIERAAKEGEPVRRADIPDEIVEKVADTFAGHLALAGIHFGPTAKYDHTWAERVARWALEGVWADLAVADHEAAMSQTDSRFAKFTGWELQCLARGVDGVAGRTQRAEQEQARGRLMEEIHQELEAREDLGFADPETTR